MNNPRTLAAYTLMQVVDSGRSLNDLLPHYREQLEEAQRGLYQQLVYGSVRYYLSLDELSRKLLEKPIKRKERIVQMLLMVGLYQLWQLDIPEHAVINETVDATKPLKKPWARALLNAAMRRFQREREILLPKLQNQAGFPGWLTRSLRQDYPEHWQAIMAESNQQGPMTLRVNLGRQSRDAWLAKADAVGLEVTPSDTTPTAVTLAQATGVLMIPGFSEGEVSVQDEAAQQCTTLLKPQKGERILDACAAPGGKTGHLLEAADIDLTALDIDAKRLERVQENLDRLQLKATLKTADASDLNTWWDKTPYDAILLDAPCSGTGVIRRHPDIKLLRRPKDIDFLVEVQATMLKQLWRTLKPGGRLLYATCSILQKENSRQIERFLAQNPDAELQSLPIPGDAEVPFGVQWLPKAGGHDGFYFALLHKTNSSA